MADGAGKNFGKNPWLRIFGASRGAIAIAKLGEPIGEAGEEARAKREPSGSAATSKKYALEVAGKLVGELAVGRENRGEPVGEATKRRERSESKKEAQRPAENTPKLWRSQLGKWRGGGSCHHNKNA